MEASSRQTTKKLLAFLVFVGIFIATTSRVEAQPQSYRDEFMPPGILYMNHLGEGPFTTADEACVETEHYCSGTEDCNGRINGRATTSTQFGNGPYCILDVVNVRCTAGTCISNTTPDVIFQGWWYAQGFCTDDYTYYSPTQSCYKPRPAHDQSCPVENPIYPSQGYKKEVVTDYRDAVGGLHITRVYSSWNPDSFVNGLFESGWFLAPVERYLRAEGPAYMYYVKSLDERYLFTGYTTYTSEDGAPYVLTQNSEGYAYVLENTETLEKEYFDVDGRLQEAKQLNGYSYFIDYIDLSIGGTTVKKPDRIYDSYGRELIFDYDAEGKLIEIEAPGNRIYQYQYDGGLLSMVLYPDGENSSYSYEHDYGPYSSSILAQAQINYPAGPFSYSNVDYDHPAIESIHSPDVIYPIERDANPLTAIYQSGQLKGQYLYDGQGRAIQTQAAGGANTADIIKNADGSITITDALGIVTNQQYQTINGKSLLVSSDREATVNCPAAANSISYNTDGFRVSETDWEGNLTTYIRDSDGLETSRTEAAGAAEERTILTEWHPDYRLPTKITYPDKIVDFVYDGSGNLLSRTESPINN